MLNKIRAIVVSADEIKKTFPNYSPKNVENIHIKSVKLADKEFYFHLRNSDYTRVVLLNGGTASGKTEFLMTNLSHKRILIYDGTMPTTIGVQIKINAITKKNKKIIIYSIIPDDLKRSFTAFLNRDRKFSDFHFYRTHSESRKTILWLAQNFKDLEINLVESSYINNKIQFQEINFKNRNNLIEYLRNIQLTKTDIIKLVI